MTLSKLSQSILEITALDGELALERIVSSARELTQSLYALLAVMNDEIGALEVLHVSGEGVQSILGERLEVDVEEGIVSFVAATGALFESGNVFEEPRYKRLFPQTSSEAAAPVRDRFGRIRAVLNVESDQRDAYGEDQRAVLVALAALAEWALELQERRVREEALIQIGSALDKALSEEALLGEVIHVAGDVLRFQAASIFILDAETGSFVLRGSTSRLKSQVGFIKYEAGEGCTGWVCETGLPILLQNPQADPRWRGRYVEFPSEEIASFLCVPILLKGRPAGAIRVLRRKIDNKFLDNRFTEADLRLMQAISEQVASGLESVRAVDRLLKSERMIAWGELSAKSSHMMGNRLFAVKGDVNELGHLLNEKVLNTEALKSLKSSLEKNVLRIEEILQDFRDFVNATRLETSEANINQLLEETVYEFVPRRGKFEVKLELADNLPAAEVDLTKLRRAIGELIENSLIHMDSLKGPKKLRISTGMFQPDLHPSITSPDESNSYLQIEFEDSGPGVDEDMKSRIFQPFFSGRVKGMGLGLSIVKGIVEGHGGKVFEAGKRGHGANFVILLPIVERP